MNELLQAPFRLIGQRLVKLNLPTDPNDYFTAVARRMGYVGKVREPSIRRRVISQIATGLAAVRISAVSRITGPVKSDSKKIEADGMAVYSSRWASIIRFMEPPVVMGCFAATLGGELENLKGKVGLFDAYVLECLGAEVTETVGDKLESALSDQFLSQAMACSRRFSPGYCDWPLALGQKAVFEFLNPESIGITIMRTGTMVPEKSITAVMLGAGKLYYKTPCPICPKKDCPYRRESTGGNF